MNFEILLTQIMLMMSIIIKSNKSPMIMIIIIVVQSLLTSIMIWSTIESSWPSYILFLIFLGGMMILFMYMVSLTTNKIPTWKKSYILMIFIVPFIKTKWMMNNSYNVEKVIESIIINEIMPLTIVMMVFLLVTLFVINMINLKNKSSMRVYKK